MWWNKTPSPNQLDELTSHTARMRGCEDARMLKKGEPGTAAQGRLELWNRVAAIDGGVEECVC